MALFLSILRSMKCAGEMQSAVEMVLASVTSSALFILQFREQDPFGLF